MYTVFLNIESRGTKVMIISLHETERDISTWQVKTIKGCITYIISLECTGFHLN
jgi:hypothetical protein